MEKILGLDLGTNSIGWAIRETSEPGNQITDFGVVTFEKGMGEDKTGEFSRAAARTTKRSSRRRYQAHKYKLWATLDILIKEGFCPLSIEGLDKWRKYEKGVGRTYPLNEEKFNNWIKLDFNNDGIPDYSSPYQLRLELITEQLDLSVESNKHKIGRALYHIAQHRGFKSSKKIQDKEKETKDKPAKETEETKDQSADDLIGAEEKKARPINELMQKHGTETVGAALAMEEKTGSVRIRKDLHQHVLRKQLQQEALKIFEHQGISFNAIFKKDPAHSSIFWQRPLRSQKSTIGKCTLEPSKARCPTSHYAFEEFRAWCFLNNIEYKDKRGWQKLTLEIKQAIYDEKFFRSSKADFDFGEIKEWLKKKDKLKTWELNYSDKTNVSACPVSARLKDIFGHDWKSIAIKKPGGPSEKDHKEVYTIEDVWHVLFSFDDENEIQLFAANKLGLDAKRNKDFLKLWYKMPVGYGMLSLKAINLILPFLRKGMIYTEAVMLAKIPELMGLEQWQRCEADIVETIPALIAENRKDKKTAAIVNNLIGRYKALEKEYRFADRNTDYRLADDDIDDVLSACKESYGEKSWDALAETERQRIFEKVKDGYAAFFASKDRDFVKLPHLVNGLKAILKDNFDLPEPKLKKLYHPSQINIYPPAKYAENTGILQLNSPVTGAFKNPMAMRTLHKLRKLVNHLLLTGKIEEDTKVVVELSRDLNDANMRWAIKHYQDERMKENKDFATAIAELTKDQPGAKANPESNDDIDKFRLWFEQVDEEDDTKKKEKPPLRWVGSASAKLKLIASAKTDLDKYRLWKEQQCRCIYTGQIIKLSDLFSENKIDFEHTVPRSKSFDNSLANLTVCEARYNRNIKKNQLPTALPNYSENVTINGREYSAIKPRLRKWEEKIELLEGRVEFWKRKSKQSPTKEQKDDAVKQKHLWMFELHYWRDKLDRFSLTEIKSGFKHSQLVDTQIISKYAFHYLKCLFTNVKVQKGINTAVFRKIYGLQSGQEPKDRSKHSHHAKDAAVLTLIPMDAKREELLEKYYQQEETRGPRFHTVPYKGFHISHVEYIENETLINYISKDNALAPAKRKLKQKGGNAERYATGDSIRGQLHQESFYGKIQVVKRDGNGKPLRKESGDWELVEKNDGFGYVKRSEVNKDLKIESITDPHVKNIFLAQMNGRTLEKTLKEDGAIWMLRKNGEKANPIRHVRCFANDISDPLPIKKHSHLSSKEYKQHYWAGNGENYAYVLYQGRIKNKIERDYVILNLYNTSKLLKHSGPNVLEVEKEMVYNKKGDKLPLLAILKSGQRVMFYKDDNPEELRELDRSDLMKRLYSIIKFEKDGRIVFGYHLEARSNNQLKQLESEFGKSISNGFTTINFEKPWPRVRLSVGNLDMLIEGLHFEILPDGVINWK